MRLEGPLQVARMITHSELALNQGRNALQGPALAGKTGRHRAAVQEPPQPGPGLLIEPRRSSRDGLDLQAAPALLDQRQTLARLTPSCRAISGCESRPGRNSRAAARRRSSICSGSTARVAKRCHPSRSPHED